MRSMILLVLLLPFASHAQKKMVLSNKTDLMGLELPQGSKKDGRAISISAASMLFSTESANTGCKLSNTEVYLIPVESHTLESLKTAITAAGYRYSPLATDNKFALVSGKGKTYIIYYGKETGWSDLYIAECQAATTQPALTGAPSNVQANPPANQVQPAVAQPGFQYTSSNFDDGWNARIEQEWVVVEKGKAKVYLFYVLPYNSSDFSGTGLMDRDFYWDRYVAPRFSAREKRYRDDGEFVSSLQPKYVEGYGIDPQTGEQRFIAMTLGISPNAAMITVACYPDEQMFRQQFPKANDKFVSDLAGMNRYNKFAIGTNDLSGTWQSGGSQMTQWYDARTGAYAGATLAATSATFTFRGNGQYESIHNGATGAVGAMNSFQQEYRGNYTSTNWSITATNRYQGKTDTFDAHYQAVRGGRLLYLNDNKGGSYLLVKIK